MEYPFHRKPSGTISTNRQRVLRGQNLHAQSVPICHARESETERLSEDRIGQIAADAANIHI